MSPENRALALAARRDEWHFALHGGEDYELLFTAPPAHAGELARRITAETGTPVAVIGEVVPAARPSELVLPGGNRPAARGIRMGPLRVERRNGMKKAMTIAGSDSGGGAGIRRT